MVVVGAGAIVEEWRGHEVVSLRVAIEIARLRHAPSPRGWVSASGDSEKLTAAKQDLINLNQAEKEAESHERRYIVNDPTTEKLGELENQNPNGLLLERDESIGWFENLEAEVAEKSILNTNLLTHHRPALPRISRKSESRHQCRGKSEFFNTLGQQWTIDSSSELQAILHPGTLPAGTVYRLKSMGRLV